MRTQGSIKSALSCPYCTGTAVLMAVSGGISMLDGVSFAEFVNQVGIPGAIIFMIAWGLRGLGNWVGPRLDRVIAWWQTEVVPRRFEQADAQVNALKSVGEGNIRLATSFEGVRDEVHDMKNEMRTGNEMIASLLRTTTTELKSEIGGQARELGALSFMLKMQNPQTGELDPDTLEKHEREIQ